METEEEEETLFRLDLSNSDFLDQFINADFSTSTLMESIPSPSGKCPMFIGKLLYEFKSSDGLEGDSSESQNGRSFTILFRGNFKGFKVLF